MHNSVAMRGLRRGGFSLHWQMTKENKKVKAIYSPTLKINVQILIKALFKQKRCLEQHKLQSLQRKQLCQPRNCWHTLVVQLGTSVRNRQIVREHDPCRDHRDHIRPSSWRQQWVLRRRNQPKLDTFEESIERCQQQLHKSISQGRDIVKGLGGGHGHEKETDCLKKAKLSYRPRNFGILKFTYDFHGDSEGVVINLLHKWFYILINKLNIVVCTV